MPPLGLVLAAGVSLVFAAQSCDVGGTVFTLDDLSDHVVVTNASTDQTALVNFSTSLDERNFVLSPGGSVALRMLAATKYTLEVDAPGDSSGLTYRQVLLDLRDKLVTLSLHPENPSADVGGALVELSTVESALAQLHGSAASQTCSAAIRTGVDGHATVTWDTSGLSGTGIWVLSCG